MILFILSFAVFLVLGTIIMVKDRKKTKEIVLFVALSLLGFIDWVSIFLDHPLKPVNWIGRVIDFLL